MADRKRAAYLERQRRYNRSIKGRARYQKYEAAHPERATRWAPIMLLKAGRKVPF